MSLYTLCPISPTPPFRFSKPFNISKNAEIGVHSFGLATISGGFNRVGALRGPRDRAQLKNFKWEGGSCDTSFERSRQVEFTIKISGPYGVPIQNGGP